MRPEPKLEKICEDILNEIQRAPSEGGRNIDFSKMAPLGPEYHESRNLQNVIAIMVSGLPRSDWQNTAMRDYKMKPEDFQNILNNLSELAGKYPQTQGLDILKRNGLIR